MAKNDQHVHGGVTWLCFRDLARWYMVLVSVLELVLWRILPNQVRLGSGCYIGIQKIFLGLCYLLLVNYINQAEDWCENKVRTRVSIRPFGFYQVFFKTYAEIPVLAWRVDWKRNTLHLESGIFWFFGIYLSGGAT